MIVEDLAEPLYYKADDITTEAAKYTEFSLLLQFALKCQMLHHGDYSLEKLLPRNHASAPSHQYSNLERFLFC